MDSDAGQMSPFRRGLARAQLAGETFVFQHPSFTRKGLGLIQRFKPTIKLGNVVVVTKHADVKDILERDDDFTVELYTPKMDRAVGPRPFILGMQNGPIYQRDITNLRKAAPHTDIPRVKDLLDEIIGSVLATARPGGRLDVVGELADVVPMTLSGRYLGAPSPPGGELITWARAVFREFFYNGRNDPAISGPAYANADLLRAHLTSVIASRKDGLTPAPVDGPDVIGRMLEMQRDGEPEVDDDWIRAYISGLIVGMLPLTSKVTSQALDAILGHPELLAGARSAAIGRDEDMLWRYISEAMRLAPQAPGQIRIANGTQTIGRNGRRPYTCAPGSRVLAATQSAMFDPDVFPRPSKVRADRPEEHLMHFGIGLHACFGHQITQKAQVPAIIGAVLRQPGLRRAPGKAGRLVWDGPFPAALEVAFDSA